jgi:hypothetical protein
MKTITAAGHAGGCELGSSSRCRKYKIRYMIGMLILLHGVVINI